MSLLPAINLFCKAVKLQAVTDTAAIPQRPYLIFRLESLLSYLAFYDFHYLVKVSFIDHDALFAAHLYK